MTNKNLNEDIPELDFGVEYPADENSGYQAGSISDALILCKSECFGFDLDYMRSIYPGMTSDDLLALRDAGAIFQDPEAFSGKEYNVWDGWVLQDQYIDGFLPDKLKAARLAEKRHPGRFAKNIGAIKAALPETVPFEDVHIALGAEWIPEDVVADFLLHLLHLKERPFVKYYPELAKWHMRFSPDQERALYASSYNNVLYGSKKTQGRSKGLTAVEIIFRILNSIPIKVYYPSVPGAAMDRPIEDPEATMLAEEKAGKIRKEFQSWTTSVRSVRERLKDAYNNRLVGYAVKRYNGDFLTLPDLNPGVCLYPYQRNAVARILLSKGSSLIAHDVGTGKTYISIVSAHELHRTGVSKKNLIVVTNSILKDFASDHLRLYPKDRILVVYPSDFSPENRNAVLQTIRRSEDYAAIYMASSSFDMIRMSKGYYVEEKKVDIRKLRIAMSGSTDSWEKNSLKIRIERLEKDLKKYVAETAETTPWLTYDKLGIQTLFVDEAQHYKNISIPCKAENMVGLHKKGAAKADELLAKVHSTPKTVFTTATPMSNSIADLFVMQSYLQPGELKLRNLDRFDMWLNTFAEKETVTELDVDGKNMRTVTRFSSFHNLPELIRLFSSVCDFYHADENGPELPELVRVDVTVPQSRLQALYTQELSERCEKVRSRLVNRTEDNLLKITVAGRANALHPGLNGVFPDEGDSESCGKLEACRDQVVRMYKEHPGTAQAIFCDLGTPKEGFNLYDLLKHLLVEAGIPAKEIAFVHDAKSEKARSKLFAAVNKAEIRVILGSTEKLGTGVNIQENLIAAHHLDVPWKPSDAIQRDGRILRQGNRSKKVWIFRYLGEKSFDAYSWQILENKERFLSVSLSGDYPGRSASDISDTVLSAAEIKALCIGDPLLKTRVETQNKLDRTKISMRQRQKQLQELQTLLTEIPQKQEEAKAAAARLQIDSAAYEACKTPIPTAERFAFGEELSEALRTNVHKYRPRRFDSYQGFDLILPPDMTPDHPCVQLISPAGNEYMLPMDFSEKMLGYSQRLDIFLGSLKKKADYHLQRIQVLEGEKLAARKEFEKGNPFEEQVQRLSTALAETDSQIAERKLKAKEAKKHEQ